MIWEQCSEIVTPNPSKHGTGLEIIRGRREGNVHSSLLSRPFDQLAPVRRGGLAGDGQALERVRLEGAGKGAQVVHDGEGVLLLLAAAGEGLGGLEEGADCLAEGHFWFIFCCCLGVCVLGVFEKGGQDLTTWCVDST